MPSPETSWFGMSAKGGGIIIAGSEYTYGAAVNFADAGRMFQFSVEGFRLGLGLGGGVNLAANFFYNVRHPSVLNGFDASDWGVNFSIPEANLGALIRSLRTYRPIMALVGMLRGVNPATVIRGMDWTAYMLQHGEAIRSISHSVYTALNVAAVGSTPAAISLEIPFAGAAVEVSLAYSWGRYDVSHVRGM